MIRILSILLLFLWSNHANAQKVSSDLAKQLENTLKNQNVTLRGSIHQNPMTYYEHNGEIYYYEHARQYPTLFRIVKDEPVQITSIKAKGDALEVSIKSPRLGKGRIAFSAPLHSPPLNQAAFEKGFALCFKDPNETTPPPELIGNTNSNVYHVATCNHLPDVEAQQPFFATTEAETAGMHACKLCFMRMPLVSDYVTERALGLYASQQVRSIGQLTTDHALQLRAQEIGQRVLDNWPVPLQGYQYHFAVMEDDEVNAYALPTGYVFVNRGLLDMAESELEVEGVMAHEIAHVERRHSYRIYRNEQKKQAIAAGVGALAGLLAGAKSKEDKLEKAVVIGGLAYALAKSATDVLFEGYPRSMEEEADAVAALYLESQYGQKGLADMTRVLRKLRYYTDYAGADQKNLQAFRSHPLLDDRIAAFTGSTVKVFDTPIRIIGTNKQGDEVVTLEMSSQRWTTPEVANRFSLDATQIMGKMYATADIGKPRNFKDIIIQTTTGQKIKLDNKEDSLIGPYEDQGFLLRGDFSGALSDLPVKEVSVTLPGSGLDWHWIKE